MYYNILFVEYLVLCSSYNSMRCGNKKFNDISHMTIDRTSNKT